MTRDTVRAILAAGNLAYDMDYAATDEDRLDRAVRWADRHCDALLAKLQSGKASCEIGPVETPTRHEQLMFNGVPLCDRCGVAEALHGMDVCPTCDRAEYVEKMQKSKFSVS